MRLRRSAIRRSTSPWATELCRRSVKRRSRRERGTIRPRPRTCTCASRAVSPVTGYHAPNRSPQGAADCNLAHLTTRIGFSRVGILTSPPQRVNLSGGGLQQGPHAAEQLARRPRLRDEGDGGIEADRLAVVRRGKATREQHLQGRRVSPDGFIELEATELWHDDVGEDEAELRAVRSIHREALRPVDRRE